jgi:hypothetical protein
LTSAIGFTVLAVISLFYSMGIYLWRVARIRQRRAVSYHDKWGPTVLCAGLVACVSVAFAYRLKYGGDGDLRGGGKWEGGHHHHHKQ